MVMVYQKTGRAHVASPGGDGHRSSPFDVVHTSGERPAMIRRFASRRSGITLTEILISIMILGVGLVSLATLFPLGLLRLRVANRQSRSGYLFESASAELSTRNLFNK